MEIKQKLRINQQVLDNLNKGYNFLNIDIERETKKHYINVLVETKQTLTDKEEKIIVKDSLYGVWSQYDRYSGNSIEKFIEKLKEFCNKPFLKLKKSNNRKDKVSGYDLRGLCDKIREETLIFSEIDIRISDLAEKKLKEKGINFEEEVKKVLATQRKTNKEHQKLIDRFVYLKEKQITLKSFLEKESYYSSKPKDRTLKILITAEEYNQKLKKIEDELKEIAKVFDLELGDFDYLKIEKKVSYEKWLESNKEELEESWDMMEDNDFNSFDDYCEQMYDECDGVICE